MSKFTQYAAVVEAKRKAQGDMTYTMGRFSIGPDSSGTLYLSKQKESPTGIKSVDSVNGITPGIAKFIIQTLKDVYGDDLNIRGNVDV